MSRFTKSSGAGCGRALWRGLAALAAMTGLAGAAYGQEARIGATGVAMGGGRLEAREAARGAVDFTKLGLVRGTLFKLDVDTTPGLAMDVVIPVPGQDLRIKLNPHSVRGENFELIEVRATGPVKLDPGPVNTLRGVVNKVDGSIVAGGVMPDGLSLKIELPDGRVYWVEPAATRLGNVDGNTHVLYTPEDVIQGMGECGTLAGRHAVHDPGDQRPQTRGLTRFNAEVALECDWEYFNLYGSSTLINSRMALVYNVMNLQYERDTDITHSIVGVTVHSTSATSDPYAQSTTGGMLDEMRAHWNFFRTGTARDIAHLFTGKPTGGVIGTAFIGVVCGSVTNGFGYGVSQTEFNSFNLSSAADLVAHETGHNWNSCHCPCASPAFTMNPNITSINRFGTVGDECSTNSVAAIVGHRNSRGCLTTTSPAGDPPLNDACASAVAIGPGTWGFGNVGATLDGPAACVTVGADVWYFFDAPNDGTATVSTCGTHDGPGLNLGMDTVVAVYTGFCGSLTQVGCNDDNTGQCGGLDTSTLRDSWLQFPMTRGTRYLIRVSGFNGSTGTGFINLSHSGCFNPGNDSCASATTVGDGSHSFSTLCATTDGFVDDDCNFFGYQQVGSDVWFNYTAQCAGSVTLSTCGSTFDTKIAVYGGGCATSANLALVCNDDASCGTGSTLTFSAAAGTTYKVRVGGYNNQQGTGTLTISNAGCPVPANNNCGNAIDVSAGGVFTGDTRGATNDNTTATCGSATASRDVWYRYNACADGTVTLHTCGTHDAGGVDTGMDSVISIFTGCGGTLLACNDDNTGQCGASDSGTLRDSWINIPVLAGSSYLVRLSPFSTGAGGPYSLTVSPALANDSCTFPAPPPAFEGANPFCTVGAQDYFGITESCGQPFKDVWFGYTATNSGPVTITTCDAATGFDTIVAVYNGGCPIFSNQALACNDDDFSCFYVRASTLSFNAVAGNYYPIRVGGFNGASGSGMLIIDAACPADISDSAGSGNPDGGVDVNDLLFFLAAFEAGNSDADLDNGSGSGTPDGGVDVNDLLYFLAHFEAGC